jgi:two-component system response regulator
MNPTILLVDDDDCFKRLIERTISHSRLKLSLQYVWNGQEAMSYLSRSDNFKDEARHPFPSLVLLDLKMPCVNGFEVLQWRSTQPELKELPFVVLTSSDLQQDKDRALELGADHYFVKPMSLDELKAIVVTVDALCGKQTRN